MTISLAVPDILVARAQSGDLEALEALYRAFETPVYNLALRVLRRPEDAEDVLQETFLEVVRSIKQYRGEGHLWGWIRQIATSKALMRIRHDRVRETELEALYQRVARLKALPARRPARERWPAVRDAVLAGRRRRRERWGVSGLAAAAALAGLLVFRPFWTKPVDAAELARVKQQSATLEQQLGRYDPDGRVTSGRSAALAAALEDRIAVIDGELAQLVPSQTQAHSADLVNLWQQRVDLMEQLMSVRVTRAAYVGL